VGKLSQLYTNKSKKTHSLKVLDIKHHNNGRFIDLYIEQPDDMSFKTLSGVGIPGSLTDDLFKKAVKLLTKSDKKDLDALLPNNGLPAPDFAAPTDQFLKLLLSKSLQKLKAGNGNNTTLKANTACLWSALHDGGTANILKANYSVIDLLELFPDLISAKDILDTLPPEHGNKTYTVDARKTIQTGNRNVFRINVAKADGPSYRALFGEKKPEGLKKGIASTYLRELKKGDELLINAAVKTPEPLKTLDEDRPLLLIAQGNSMIKMLPILEEIQQRAVLGKKKQEVVIISAVQSEKDILELEHLKKYLDDNLLDALHICLSEGNSSVSHTKNKISFHYNTKIQNLFSKSAPPLLSKPYIFVCGGKGFCEGSSSVSKAAADFYGFAFPDNNEKNIRISSAPDRRHALQGKPYPSVNPQDTIKAFDNRGNKCGNNPHP
jgi:NAD(P)H-flavin reductase